MGKVNKLVITLVLAIIILIPLSMAAVNFVDQALSVGKGVNVGQSYNNYAPFVDAVLYFILFIGVAKMALGAKFGDVKTVPIIIGIILAIGMCVFELKTGFNIGKMWWFVGLLFFILLAADEEYKQTLG